MNDMTWAGRDPVVYPGLAADRPRVEGYVVTNNHAPNIVLEDGPDWEPGDPFVGRGGTYGRPMFEVLPVYPARMLRAPYWCHGCDVAWSDLEAWVPESGAPPMKSPCWLCGKPTDPMIWPSEEARREDVLRRAGRRNLCDDDYE